MTARLALLRFPSADPEDPDSLAAEAAYLIESYQGSWANQVPEKLRIEKLTRAIGTLQRVKEMENG